MKFSIFYIFLWGAFPCFSALYQGMVEIGAILQDPNLTQKLKNSERSRRGSSDP